MPSEKNIKRLMSSMLGTSVLACSLATLPITLDVKNGYFTGSHAWAKDGDSGEGGDSGESGESGEFGESGESGNSGKGSKNSGKSGESGKNGKKGRDRDVPERFGKVIRARSSEKEIEIRYSDGWREEIRSDRYRLKNQRGENIISRIPRPSDWVRMRNVLKKVK